MAILSPFFQKILLKNWALSLWSLHRCINSERSYGGQTPPTCMIKIRGLKTGEFLVKRQKNCSSLVSRKHSIRVYHYNVKSVKKGEGVVGNCSIFKRGRFLRKCFMLTFLRLIISFENHWMNSLGCFFDQWQYTFYLSRLLVKRFYIPK